MGLSPLTINGKQIRQLEALRESFDLLPVLEYYKNGKLLKWLQDRFYENEAAALELLDENAPDFVQQLCAIFGVEYSGEEIDIEEIAQKQERLAKLRTYTDDAEVISNIELVAFDQEELAELLHSGAEKIYLCADSFVVPVSQKNKCYIGINNPAVHIGGEIPENWDEQSIEFVDCMVDNLPEEPVTNIVVTENNDNPKQENLYDPCQRVNDVVSKFVEAFKGLTEE